MPKVGDLIAGKYRLEKVAGEGGMGIVYAARHLVLEQRVAVKVLLHDAASSEAVVERFVREGQAAARIQSEHVARVLDAGSLANGAPFLVLEYLEGCDLEELLQLQGPLPIPEVADYMLQALEALAHAHAAGIVHRDLKPANLFLACKPDGGNILKMLDFGISKAMTARPEQKVLTGQAVLGSPAYMSPEQLRNAKDIDARADIWSLGVVAYELLTGTPPFDGEGVGEIFAAILEKDPAPLDEVDPKIPKALAAAIAKCLRRKPEDRWADTSELARAVLPFAGDASSDVPLRIEQLLARSKMFAYPETLPEARRVVDLIADAARRARTTEGAPALELSTKKKAAPESSETAARPMWRRSAARWGGLGAAAVVAIGAFAAIASGRGAKAAAPTAAVTPALSLREAQRTAPAKADSVTAPPDGSPSAIERPGAPALAGASRPRGKPGGKPQRPKLLNSRE